MFMFTYSLGHTMWVPITMHIFTWQEQGRISVVGVHFFSELILRLFLGVVRMATGTTRWCKCMLAFHVTLALTFFERLWKFTVWTHSGTRKEWGRVTNRLRQLNMHILACVNIHSCMHTHCWAQACASRCARQKKAIQFSKPHPNCDVDLSIL